MKVAEYLERAAAFSQPGAGVTRLAWSPELFELYDWTLARGRELGMEGNIDAAGNLILRWPVGDGLAVMAASHLDTVPSGGAYDGALGVFAALRAVELLQAAGATPAAPIWIAAFMDEEGSRFGASMFGSRAFAGEDVAPLLAHADGDGITVADAMRERGLEPGRAGEAAAIDQIGSYLELHIEQGPVLEEARIDVGVVQAIVGLVRLEAVFTGAPNHAGTTPMRMRRDALAAAARAVMSIRDRAAGGDEFVATVGVIQAMPGSYNVIPGTARISIDVRCGDADGLKRAVDAVAADLRAIAVEEGTPVELREVHRLEPTPLDAAMVDAVEAAARGAGASVQRMVSGAGHDAMVIARHVPAAMLFVPSIGGVSHSPAERTEAEACEVGARVLAEAIRASASLRRPDAVADRQQNNINSRLGR